MAPGSTLDQQSPREQDRNEVESNKFDNGSVASTAAHPPIPHHEDAGQDQSDANTDVAEAVTDKSTPNTASSLAIDQHDNFANLSEDDLEKSIKGLIQEEKMLQDRESENSWTPQDAERLQSVRERIHQLDEVLKKRSLPQAKAAANCFGHNQLPKSSMPVNKTKKAQDPKKRKLDAAKNDSPVAKKPRTNKKPTKGQIKAVDFVTKGAFNQMAGETEESFNADAVKDLEPISKAPIRIREHLKAIQAAGLRLPDAKSEIVKAHAKALGGISQAFRTIVSPWVAEGDGEKTVEDFKWQIAGLRHPLHHHQLVAAGNMSTIEKDDENDSTTKFGLRSGFLYDHMGYGKTLETLACIVSNPPRSKRSMNGSSTTLVVVPKSAAKQWFDEVGNHCTDLQAMLYNKDSDATKLSRQNVLSADILIVTYDQLRATDRKLKEKKIAKSLLFESKFYRLILDESHKVKNPNSEIFKVCLKLKSKHKWCLTGTPIQNGVFEIYAPLKFLGHPLVGEFSEFKEKYLGGRGGRNLPTEGPRYSELSRILEPVMIMRRPGHSFLGRPLVTLPESYASLVDVELSREEEVIQEFVDEYIGAYLKKKTTKPTKKPDRRGKSKTQAVDEASEEFSAKSLYEVLLRKRQAVASPALLENLVKGGIWTLDQIRSMKHEVQKNGIADTPFIDLFIKWMKEPKLPKLSSAGRKAAAELAMVEAAKCTQCHEILSEEREPQESECGCRYCKGCLDFTIGFLRFSKKGEEPRCPRCSRKIGEYQPCSLLPMDDAESQKTKAGRARLRGDDYNGFQPQDSSGSTLMQILDASSAVPQSSKMKAVLKQIQDWHQEARDDKVIVFSNFIGATRLLGRILQDNGIEFLYFIGEMNDDQRQSAISAFKIVSDIKVLVSRHSHPALTCGSFFTDYTQDDVDEMRKRESQSYCWKQDCNSRSWMAQIFRAASNRESIPHRPDKGHPCCENSGQEHRRLRDLQASREETRPDGGLTAGIPRRERFGSSSTAETLW